MCILIFEKSRLTEIYSFLPFFIIIHQLFFFVLQIYVIKQEIENIKQDIPFKQRRLTESVTATEILNMQARGMKKEPVGHYCNVISIFIEIILSSFF